jgi:hypothetical protein
MTLKDKNIPIKKKKKKLKRREKNTGSVPPGFFVF